MTSLNAFYVQVVAMKLECNPESFKTDPEGSRLACDINQHMPAEVQLDGGMQYACFLEHKL